LTRRFKLGVPLIVSALVCACTSASRRDVDPAAPQEQTFSSIPPFKTIEPLKYRAERSVTYTDNQGTSTITRTSIARDGDLRREDFEIKSSKIATIQNGGTRVLLVPDERIYADVNLPSDVAALADLLDSGSSPELLLHEQTPVRSSYERLGTEEVDGRTTTKYRVVVNNLGGASVSKLETLIWIDEALGMPIRSESKSDGQQSIMNLTNISLTVDGSLFQIPEGYKKVATTEITQRLGRQ